ncbi:MAG: cell division protein FtsZ [Immundisolibacter sp.]|uniref:cell division protein FtsZ n=1 Tax=Immundisolibacter sp. TaxID=1934948 RepID=UPI003564E7B9
MFELMEPTEQNAVIKVIGVGGGGGNAIEHMLAQQIDGVDFIVANTDAQVLGRTSAGTVLQLGTGLTKGLGAGANPAIGAQAAMEDKDRIADSLEGADMVFITAGMGGGTGTGAAPIIAQIARELGILTVAVVTKPFSFEGRKRLDIANEGIAALAKHVDSLIIIPNDKLVSELDRNFRLIEAFKAANQVLQGAVQGIAELITRPGLINVDFADVRTVMSEMGMAMMGSSSASGDGRARQAAEAAISSPFLEDINLSGARGILVNITAGLDMSIGEFEEVGNVVRELASPDACVVIGTVIDPELSDLMRVTVVATGLDRKSAAPTTADRHAERPMEVVRTGTDPYKRYDQPTVIRKERPRDATQPFRDSDMEYLEIPAFLRRQAD